MHAEKVLPWIILAPMIGSLANATMGRANRALVRPFAIGSVAIAFGLAVYAFFSLATAGHAEGEHGAHRLYFEAFEWFSMFFGDRAVPVKVAFVMDQLSGIMTLMVTGIGLFIHFFASSYMHDDPGYPRFFAYLNLFMASMLILVLGSNMPLMFVGWEGVGLCSYLLIGFWWENPAYAAAGKKAFIVNRIGDFGVLIGMFLLASAAGSFEFDAMREAAPRLIQPALLGAAGHALPITTATLACLFLFLGCSGKSAQLPLYVWLPDAMAGPTPVSALIHAATMVTSGIYLCVRLAPVFAMSTTAMAVIAIVGTLTAFGAACVGLVQNQMKKILAYSTVSQLGFMFAAVGVGAFAGGIFHVFTHAFFKACLFLGAGSVMHAVHAHGDADIRELGGMKKFMPKTHITFLVSCLAIAGFPLTSGFFSKDDILLGAMRAANGHYEGFPTWVGYFVFVTLAITAAMTAFYMFRLYFVTFTGEFRGGPKHEDHGDAHASHDDHAHDDHAHDDHGHGHGHGHAHEPHESDAWITIPLMVLATGALLVGFLGMPHWAGLPNVWEHWLEPITGNVYGESHLSMGFGLGVMAVGTSVGLLGIGLAYSFYVKGNGEVPAKIVAKFPKLHALLMDKWRVDEFYGVTLVKPAEWLSRFSAAFDRLLVDGIVSKLTSMGASLGAYGLTRLQNGQIAAYGATMVAGLAVMTWWFSAPHAHIESTRTEGTLKLSTAKGFGYSYRWDLDNDGTFDTEWGTDNEASPTFDGEDIKHGVVVFTPARLGAEDREIAVGERVLVLDPADLSGNGRNWREGEDMTPPAMSWRDGKLVILKNGALVQSIGGTTNGNELTLAPGDRAVIGAATIRVAVGVQARVEVKSAFGYVSQHVLDITLDEAPGAPAHASLGGGAQ